MCPLCSACPWLLRAEMALTELCGVTFSARSFYFPGEKCEKCFKGEREPARVKVRTWGQGRSGGFSL